MVFILLLLSMWKEDLSLKNLAEGKWNISGKQLISVESLVLFTFNTSLDESLDSSLAILLICRIWESFYMLLAALQVS